MRNMEFASWLAGFVLICEPTALSPTQIKCIESHAKLCEYTEKGRLTITNHMIRYMLHEVSIEDFKTHVLMQFETLPSHTSEEICYFLQGVFEIDGRCEWSLKDVEIVSELLDCNTWGLAPFLIELYYKLLAFSSTKKREPDGNNSIEQTELIDLTDIKHGLEAMFVHEIDPSYDYDPIVASRLHSGGDISDTSNDTSSDTSNDTINDTSNASSNDTRNASSTSNIST